MHRDGLAILVGARRDAEERRRDRRNREEEEEEEIPGFEAALPPVLSRTTTVDDEGKASRSRSTAFPPPLCDNHHLREIAHTTWTRKCVTKCKAKTVDGHTHSRLSVICIIKEKTKKKERKREKKMKKQENILYV